MLLSYTAKNFGSFKDKFEFSMKPGRVIDRFEDNVIDIDGVRKVSKVAVIVGENAGGKTSFMKSLHFFQYFIGQDGMGASLKELCYDYNNDIPQSFEIVALVDRYIYTYSMEIDKLSIVEEKLSVRGLNQRKSSNKVVYKLSRIEIDDDERIISEKYELNETYIDDDIVKLINKTGLNSGILLNTLNKFKVKIVQPFADWINNKLVIKLPSDHSLNVYKRIQKSEKDLEILDTKEFLDIFSIIDSSIVGISIDEKEPFSDSYIIRKKGDGRQFRIKLKNDSSGVNDFFAWSVELWKVVYENATLFADELDKVLNSILASRVLNYIKATEHQVHFFFSTHKVLHINTIDFMKEQIYFVNKDRNTLESKLYPLSSFKEYRYEKSKVYELYLKGLLGGVPNE